MAAPKDEPESTPPTADVSTAEPRASTDPAHALDDYEREQLLAILAWRSESPSIASQALVRLLSPAVFVVDKMVPLAAMEGLIDSARWAGMKLTDSQDLLKKEI